MMDRYTVPEFQKEIDKITQLTEMMKSKLIADSYSFNISTEERNKIEKSLQNLKTQMDNMLKMLDFGIILHNFKIKQQDKLESLFKDLHKETFLIDNSKPIKETQERNKKNDNTNNKSEVIDRGLKEEVFENKDSIPAELYQIETKICDNANMQVKIEIKNNLRDKTEISYKLLEQEIFENEESTSTFKVVLNIPIPSQRQDETVYKPEMISENLDEEVFENGESTLIPPKQNHEVSFPKRHFDNDLQVKIISEANDELAKETTGGEDSTSEIKVIPKKLRSSNKMDKNKPYQSNSLQKLVNKTVISDNSLNKNSSNERLTDTIEHNKTSRDSMSKISHLEDIPTTSKSIITKLAENYKLKLLETSLLSKVDSEESNVFSLNPKNVHSENYEGNVKSLNDMHINDTDMDTWETVSYHSALKKIAPSNIEAIPVMQTNEESKCNILTEDIQAKKRSLAEFHSYIAYNGGCCLADGSCACLICGTTGMLSITKVRKHFNREEHVELSSFADNYLDISLREKKMLSTHCIYTPYEKDCEYYKCLLCNIKTYSFKETLKHKQDENHKDFFREWKNSPLSSYLNQTEVAKKSTRERGDTSNVNDQDFPDFQEKSDKWKISKTQKDRYFDHFIHHHIAHKSYLK